MSVRKTRTFYRFLLTYATVLVVPLFFITLFINKTLLFTIKNESISSSTNNLLKAKEQMDKNLRDMERISINASLNRRLTPGALNTDNYGVYEGMHDLKLYMDANEFIFDLGYYIRGSNRIIMATQAVDLKMLTEKIYNISNKDYEKIYYELNNIKYPTIYECSNLEIIGGKRNEIILYFYPIDLQAQYATIAFFIDNSKVKELFKRDLKEFNENVIILDSNKKQITSVDNGLVLKENELDDLYKHIPQKNKNGYVNIEQGKYLITVAWSDYNSFTYISVAEKEGILQKVNDVRKTFYTYMLFTFIIGAIVIAIGIYISYTPIYHLKKLILHKFPLQDSVIYNDDIDTISNGFIDMININDSLTQNMEQLKHELRKNAFTELIKGGASNYSGLLAESFDEFRVDKSYRVCIIWSNSLSENGRLDNEKFIKDKMESKENSIKVYTIDTLEDDKLVIVISFAKNDRNIVIDELETLRLNAHISGLGIAEGSECEDILSIAKSYEEACRNLLDYVKESEFKDKALVEISDYPFEALDRLATQIRNGWKEDIKNTLEYLMGRLISKNMSRFLKNCIMFDILNIIMKLSVEFNNEGTAKTINSINSLFTISDYRDFTKKYDIVNELCQTLCSYSSENISSNHLVENIYDYINKNYTDPDLSLNKIALQFGFTVPYISQIFKQHFGKNISIYINDLRMEKAKKLILENQLNMKQIMLEVGYNYESSFCRAFKKKVGLTPNEFKESCKIE